MPENSLYWGLSARACTRMHVCCALWVPSHLCWWVPSHLTVHHPEAYAEQPGRTAAYRGMPLPSSKVATCPCQQPARRIC